MVAGANAPSQLATWETRVYMWSLCLCKYLLLLHGHTFSMKICSRMHCSNNGFGLFPIYLSTHDTYCWATTDDTTALVVTFKIHAYINPYYVYVYCCRCVKKKLLNIPACTPTWLTHVSARGNDVVSFIKNEIFTIYTSNKSPQNELSPINWMPIQYV